MSDRPWLARFIWWHRLHRHSVIRGYNILNPVIGAYRCEDCDLTWEMTY